MLRSEVRTAKAQAQAEAQAELKSGSPCSPRLCINPSPSGALERPVDGTTSHFSTLPALKGFTSSGSQTLK